MCNCFQVTCPICVDQTRLWIAWVEYVEKVRAPWTPHTRNEQDLRLGQYLFNLLCECNPDVANQIRGSILDPFYNDDVIPDFLEKVDELWTV